MYLATIDSPRTSISEVLRESEGHPTRDSPWTALGSTRARQAGCLAARQLRQACASHAQRRRSAAVKRRRGRRDRFTTASWCRSAMISRCNEARDWTTNRSEWSSDTMTDDTTAGYRRTPATLIDANAYGVLGSHTRQYIVGCCGIRGSVSTSRRRTARGSISWSNSSPCSPNERSNVGRTRVCRNYETPSWPTSPRIMTTRSRFGGPRRPTRSSTSCAASARARFRCTGHERTFDRNHGSRTLDNFREAPI